MSVSSRSSRFLRASLRCTASAFGSAAVAAIAFGASASAAPQASFVETFDAIGAVSPGADGPASLIGSGWIFRNQSAPKGGEGWKAGVAFAPQAGAGYLGATSLATDFFGGKISLWAILPTVAGQQAGDTLTIHLRSIESSNLDALQVRYSPSGGKSTGSGADAVGDFTTLLGASAPMPTTGWVKYEFTLPGAGAIALRYFVPSACNWACFASSIGIDTVSVGVPPPPPCNLPPIPAPGGNATWTAAGGPYRVCSDLTIPDGATVFVQPGVRIDVDPGFTLGVAGAIVVQGTAASPVEITGMDSGVTPPIRIHGEADCDHLTMHGRFQVAHGGSASIVNSSFGSGTLWTDDWIGGGDRGTFVSIAGCHFQSGQLYVIDGTLALRDTTFQASTLNLLRGYLLLDDVQMNGGGVSVIRERFTQPLFLDALSVTNVNGPALTLSGWDFQLGANSQLTGNQLPVQLDDAGLLAGSVVPTSGNGSNFVAIGDQPIASTVHWSQLAVPYVAMSSAQSFGNLHIGEGVTIEYGPGASPAHSGFGIFRALGRPGNPIQLRRHSSGQAWNALVFASNGGGPRLEHCIVDGSSNGVIANDGIVHVTNSTFSNNGTAAGSATFGILHARGSRFLGNSKGVNTTTLGSADLDGTTNPNSFVGNGIAVSSGGGTVPAKNNWWGHPTGPSHFTNPTGGGDVVTGAISVTPFLTSPPDAYDHAPIVRLRRLSDLLETGKKVILHWDVEDDGAIASQRIEFSPHGNWDSFFQPVVANLPANARSYEWTVPVVFPSSVIQHTFVRVIAVDDSGKEAFDELQFHVPYTQDIATPSLAFTTNLAGPFTFGEGLDICWNYSGPSGTYDTAIVIDGELEGVPYGGGTTLTNCWSVKMPYVSTDRARFRVTFSYGAGGRDVAFYSEPFSIRPDARLLDAPPTVALTSPSPGAVIASEGVVPISWTASDDEAIRAFAIQASYDGGRTWHMIDENLPPSATHFQWRLPVSAGIANARVRVVASDRRFQTSSAEAPIAITATGTVCQSDVGFGGPGGSVLSVCGGALAGGNSATLLLSHAPAKAAFWLIASIAATPTPAFGGTLLPLPAMVVLPAMTDGAGQFSVAVPGGLGPVGLYAQCLILDPSQPVGIGLSNAIVMQFLP